VTRVFTYSWPRRGRGYIGLGLRPRWRFDSTYIGRHPCDDYPYIGGYPCLTICLPPLAFGLEWEPNIRLEWRPK
jgi:hypothetical protein